MLAFLAVRTVAMHHPAIDCQGMTMDRIVSCEDAEAIMYITPASGTRNGRPGLCEYSYTGNTYTAVYTPAHASLHPQHAPYQMFFWPAVQCYSLAVQHPQADLDACIYMYFAVHGRSCYQTINQTMDQQATSCSTSLLYSSEKNTKIKPDYILFSPSFPQLDPVDLTDTQMMLTWGLSECLCAPLVCCGCAKATGTGLNTLVALHSHGQALSVKWSY